MHQSEESQNAPIKQSPNTGQMPYELTVLGQICPDSSLLPECTAKWEAQAWQCGATDPQEAVGCLIAKLFLLSVQEHPVDLPEAFMTRCIYNEAMHVCGRLSPPSMAPAESWLLVIQYGAE